MRSEENPERSEENPERSECFPHRRKGFWERSGECGGRGGDCRMTIVDFGFLSGRGRMRLPGIRDPSGSKIRMQCGGAGHGGEDGWINDWKLETDCRQANGRQIEGKQKMWRREKRFEI